MKRYQVLVVDDSAFMRKIITDMIDSSPNFEVVATARNGHDALEKLKQHDIDVVTMDVEMPVMNGLETLRKIMKDRPVPVVMVSSLTQEGTKETIEALEVGAVDFVGKPSGSISLDLPKVKDELLHKLHVAARSNVSNRNRAKLQEIPQAEPKIKAKAQLIERESSTQKRITQIVGIGTSTGGPRALQQVLTRLPADFPAPIVIVQHMPPNFTASLAQRLDMISSIHVEEATDGRILEPGTAYIAPGGLHMQVKRVNVFEYRIQLNDDAPVSGHRPSVDHLFQSLVPLNELKRHIVLMTGMGSDGAQAMKQLKMNGAETTIAESEETCIVYGMPRSAIELNAANMILPLDRIADTLIDQVNAYR